MGELGAWLLMNAFDLIKRFEGFRTTPYWDVNAYRTGYGSDTVTLADGSSPSHQITGTHQLHSIFRAISNAPVA